MFCPECKCEFVGWTGKCPSCKTRPVEKAPSGPGISGTPIAHEALLERVREAGGQLTVDLWTTEVEKERKWRFPYLGYGRAWGARMQGVFKDTPVDLVTTEIGRARRWRFPYLGYGFACAKKGMSTLRIGK